ncbi:MAG: hypothetical protein OEY86_15880 [Nitrospira sp.]|nr:hypothetical protein [Nitrospira sp.]
MPWYVIRTKPHQERIAHVHLNQLCEETLLPMLKLESAVEPLFPGYLFARFDLQDRYRAVKFARGVLNIVEFGLQPAEVGDTTIEAIKERLEDGYVRIVKPSLREGQVVRIASGPLAGLEVVFLRDMKKQQRVCVLLTMLGRHTEMTINRDQIRLPHAV